MQRLCTRLLQYTIVLIYASKTNSFEHIYEIYLKSFFLANGMIEFFGPDRQKERNQKGVKTNRHEEKNQQNQTRLNSIQ